jgi:hypothetical protein
MLLSWRTKGRNLSCCDISFDFDSLIYVYAHSSRSRLQLRQEHCVPPIQSFLGSTQTASRFNLIAQVTLYQLDACLHNT